MFAHGNSSSNKSLELLLAVIVEDLPELTESDLDRGYSPKSAAKVSPGGQRSVSEERKAGWALRLAKSLVLFAGGTVMISFCQQVVDGIRFSLILHEPTSDS